MAIRVCVSTKPEFCRWRAHDGSHFSIIGVFAVLPKVAGNAFRKCLLRVASFRHQRSNLKVTSNSTYVTFCLRVAYPIVWLMLSPKVYDNLKTGNQTGDISYQFRDASLLFYPSPPLVHFSTTYFSLSSRQLFSCCFS